ncbi:hypothetical protein GOARA_062_00540 [Gordonia araii NBRC 100433]|uniref:YbjN domain-containing protein n=1 Tax=Gordonia araii NBRC 100433 TaxID=1073574 RepID=G7H4L1_9ACTN|nr:hypothetical protein [Gordonia araii]NNG96157.1 hypothetical protein [Gordonia araii NBRC 100433]GAB10786.1 hypothetical protein GOARA_062_00540 [Gordonia araii NBRC 100433]
MSDIKRIAALLGELGTVETADDESVLVHVGTTRASVRVLDLSEELKVVSVTQLVARKATNDERLRDLLDERGASLSFGSLRRTDPGERHTDVLLSYAFPLGDLDDIPLLTVFHLVLSGGSSLAEDLA